MPKLTPPEDQSITTLFLGNLGRESRLVVTEADIRLNFIYFFNINFVFFSIFSDYFYQFGELRQVHVVANKCCAFIQFTTRQAAEMAADRTFEQLVLKVQFFPCRFLIVQCCSRQVFILLGGEGQSFRKYRNYKNFRPFQRKNGFFLSFLVHF